MKYTGATDIEILKDIIRPEDKDHEVFKADNTYRWYYGIGMAFRPATIAEIGVAWGYSLYALATGSMMDPLVMGFDNESYFPGCLTRTKEKLESVVSHLRLVHADSQELRSIPNPWVGYNFDIFHIDGDHTQSGCLHDMGIAWPTITPGGIMLVDDIDHCSLGTVVSNFARDNKSDMLYLPTFRGLGLIPKPL